MSEKRGAVQVNVGTMRLLRRVFGEMERGTGLSQKELALRSGLSPSLVAMVEAGERQPSFTAGVALARGFGHGVLLTDFATISDPVLQAMAATAAEVPA